MSSVAVYVVKNCVLVATDFLVVGLVVVAVFTVFWRWGDDGKVSFFPFLVLRPPVCFILILVLISSDPSVNRKIDPKYRISNLLSPIFNLLP